jgi:hypothetical protein
LRVIGYILSRESNVALTDVTPLEFIKWIRRKYGLYPAITSVLDVTQQEAQKWQAEEHPTTLRRDM